MAGKEESPREVDLNMKEEIKTETVASDVGNATEEKHDGGQVKEEKKEGETEEVESYDTVDVVTEENKDQQTSVKKDEEANTNDVDENHHEKNKDSSESSDGSESSNSSESTDAPEVEVAVEAVEKVEATETYETTDDPKTTDDYVDYVEPATGYQTFSDEHDELPKSGDDMTDSGLRRSGLQNLFRPTPAGATTSPVHHYLFTPDPKTDSAMPVKEKEQIQDDSDLARLTRIDSDNEDVYSEAGKSRGVCLLFENDMFHTDLGLSKRKGSSVDRALAIKTFTKIGFKVRVYQNLSTSDIMANLEAASLEDHKDNDMFCVVILSHGNEGILYGYDAPYATDRVWRPFTADSCPSLAGKPKLFFLQACQGSKLDSGIVVKENRTSQDSFATYKTPLHADFLLVHSTVAGYYSWRNTLQGSWFIQVLGEALLANYLRHDLQSILTRVTKVVAKDFESSSSRPEFNKKKQVPFIYSTLTAKIFFNKSKNAS